MSLPLLASLGCFGLVMLYLWLESRSRSSQVWYRVSLLLTFLLLVTTTWLGWIWLRRATGANYWLVSLHGLVGVLMITLAAIKLVFASNLQPQAARQLFRSLSDYQVAVLDYESTLTETHQPFTRPTRRLIPFTTKTQDGITIRGVRLCAEHKKVVVIAHGAFRSKNTFPYTLLAQWLAYRYDVVSFDFRGHGESGGQFDFSEKTAWDLQAVLHYVYQLNYERVGVIGRSMGAWTALIEHRLADSSTPPYRVDSLIAAAAPLRQITAIDTAQKFRRWLKLPLVGWLFKYIGSLFVNLGRGTRIADLGQSKYCPIEVATDLTIPVFLIYQEYDLVIKTNVEDAVELYETLRGPKQLLILAGPGHIFETASFHKLYQAIEDWFERTLGLD
jgi:pimeloyl-ACP methyl ester carboxylesterase